MSAQRFQPGELVDVTIKGARVSDKHTRDKHLHLFVGEETFHLPVRMLDRVAITRVAPAEWPPLVGDVWEDVVGSQWFTRYYEGEPYLVSTAGDHNDPAAVLASIGPMTLAYRKGWTPTPTAVDQADEPTADPEGRAAVVAGFRQLADLIERTDVPVPDVWRLGQAAGWATFVGNSFVPRYASGDEAIDRLRAWAEECGVEHRTKDVGADVYHNVDVRLGGVSVELSHIETGAATTTDLPPGGKEVAGSGGDGPGPATAPTFDLGPVPDADGDLIAPVEPHVCQYVEPDGTTAGVCHLPGVHGGRAPAVESDADTDPGEPEVGGHWCAVNGTRCTIETDPCHLCPTAAEPIPIEVGADDTPGGEPR